MRQMIYMATCIGLLGGADASSAADPLVGLYFGEKIGVLDEARSWPCYLRQPAHRRHVVEAIQ